MLSCLLEIMFWVILNFRLCGLLMVVILVFVLVRLLLNIGRGCVFVLEKDCSFSSVRFMFLL